MVGELMGTEPPQQSKPLQVNVGATEAMVPSIVSPTIMYGELHCLRGRIRWHNFGRSWQKPGLSIRISVFNHVLNCVLAGKTSVAMIYGEILRDLGLLSKGEVIVKNPSDFLGSVLGESEKKTNAILDAALGCVLVIDEAYGLHGGGKSRDPYKVRLVLQVSIKSKY